MEQNIPSQRQGVSAALAAAQARAPVAAPVCFPGEDGGQSLVAMAQRDLDAALQLLADRAQYITGATGAAIALRRDGRDDMLCRASVGSNAPELGALLSTEFGLSGESVRTRQLLRCDDAERDARVNREVCRQMGIASVLVMPVVNDDQVLGVFELFSGRANAFGERDLSAMQRLSEMVETAVRLAHAAQTLPERLSERETSVAQAVHSEVFEGQFLSDLVVEESKQQGQEQSGETIAASALESPVTVATPTTSETISADAPPEPDTRATSPMYAAAIADREKKPLFWSAAETEGEAANTNDADLSRVPPMLRGLRKCEACGFPISAGRVLCVECEEKKWRGQLRPQGSPRKPPGIAPVVSISRGSLATAAAPSMVKAVVAPAEIPSECIPALMVVPPVSAPIHAEPDAVAREGPGEPVQAPELILSAGIEPARSWFSTYKYIVIPLVVIGVAAAAFLILR